jgi:hypothetical protein
MQPQVGQADARAGGRADMSAFCWLARDERAESHVGRMSWNIRSECVKSMADAEKRPKTLNISEENLSQDGS